MPAGGAAARDAIIGLRMGVERTLRISATLEN
jgi:hypothetical protein